MSIEVKVPQLPESVADATLVNWHKSPGEAVARDENLVDLETDKVVLEVPAPAAGVLKEIRIESGATVTSGELLAMLEPAAAGQAAAPAAAAAAAPAAEAAPAAAPVAAAEPANDSDEHAAKLSPAVRRLLEENDLDPAQIPGTGRGGRILKSDVQTYLDRQVHPAGDTEDMPVPAEVARGGCR